MAEVDERAVVLVHSSDLHVDDESGPGRYNGNLGLSAVLRTAEAAGADVVLLSGDTFDNPRVSLAVLQRTAELLAAAPMPVVMLPGNHDPLLPACIFRRSGIADIAHVHVIGLIHADAVVFERHELEIRGRAHVGFSDMDPLHAPQKRRTRWRVVMAHGHYVPPDEWTSQAHRSWRISDDAIASSDADYVALGHWERPMMVGDGRVPAHYSGSPDLAQTVNVVRLLRDGGPQIGRMALSWD